MDLLAEFSCVMGGSNLDSVNHLLLQRGSIIAVNGCHGSSRTDRVESLRELCRIMIGLRFGYSPHIGACSRRSQRAKIECNIASCQSVRFINAWHKIVQDGI